MLILVVSTLLFAQIQAQYNSLQGTNYNIGDQSRQEVVDDSGNIRGQYSYVDPNGKTVIVRYTAGQNGFQVENGPAAAPLSQPQVLHSGFSYRPAPAPQPQAQVLQPGVSYRGLQIGRSKYLGQLFRPAPANTQPAYTAKQLENYQNALAENNNQLADATPAQFPNNLPAPAALVGGQVTQASPSQFQQFQFLPQNTGLNTPSLFQTTNNLNLGNSVQYATNPSPLLFQPSSNPNPNLREIAQNPIPPEFKAPPPARIATPITEEGDDGAVFDNRYINFNY